MRSLGEKSVRVFAARHERLFYALFGLLSALPFVVEKLFFVSLVVYVPLFYPLIRENQNGKRAFRSLFCFFYPFYFVLYHWFVCLYPLDFAGLGGFESVIVIAIALVFVPLLHTLIMSLCIALCYKLCRNVKVLLPLVFAFSYMLGEYLQSVGTFAFPWGRLFVGQIEFLPFLQSASLFGSYFITFIIILINALLAYSYASTGVRKTVSALIVLFVFLSNLTFGVVRLAMPLEYENQITVAALQGNMSSEIKWSGSATQNAAKRYLEAAEDAKQYALENGKIIDLFVTAETAFPVTLVKNGRLNETQGTSDTLGFVLHVLQDTDAVLLLGAFSEYADESYNSVYMCTKDGIYAKTYDKQHIVPFGEFLPYRSIIETLVPPFRELNLMGEDLARGEDEEPFETEKGKIASLVCFDSVFPSLCREQVKNGARIVAVSTNDSWYKTSKALSQHAAHSVMRAIENNVSLVRSANTGISMTINPRGEVTKSLGALKTGFVCDTLPITSEVSLYTKIGDVIVPIGTVFILLIAVLSACKRKNR